MSSNQTSVLVLNLARLGDLLQMQPLLGSLALNGARTGLICLESFLDAVTMLRGPEDVWPLPSRALLANTGSNWPKNLNLVTSFAREIRGHYSHIVNLSPTIAARMLTRLLAGNELRVLGFSVDDEGFGVNSGAWAAFLSISSLRRMSSPFNIADVFRMMGMPLAASPGPNAWQLAGPDPVAKDWANDFLRGRERLVAFQPGASDSARQWPIENFVALGRKLHAAGYCPLLVGAPEERELATRFAAQADFPHVDAVGRTDIPKLAALLERCRLLVTNDTGTMHLASGLAVPCLAFFLATAQPWDTGPYAPGNCCLEPAMDCHPCSFNSFCLSSHACRQNPAPEFAADLALSRLETGQWRDGLSPQLCSKNRVWLTGRDSCGFAALTCISGHEGSAKSACLAWERYFWRQLLDSLDGMALPCAEIKPAFPAPAEYVAEAIPVLRKVAAILDSLRDASSLIAKNQRAGAILLRGCENVQALLDGCQPLTVLGGFVRELLNQNHAPDKFGHILQILARHLQNYADDLQQTE